MCRNNALCSTCPLHNIFANSILVGIKTRIATCIIFCDRCTRFGGDPCKKILLLGILCAGVSVLFCILLREAETLFSKNIQNPYLRILIASGMLWILLLFVRNQDYIGLGTNDITQSIAGETIWYAFLMKMLFTAITLAGRFKGGEIIPSFFYWCCVWLSIRTGCGTLPVFLCSDWHDSHVLWRNQLSTSITVNCNGTVRVCGRTVLFISNFR